MKYLSFILLALALAHAAPLTPHTPRQAENNALIYRAESTEIQACHPVLELGKLASRRALFARQDGGDDSDGDDSDGGDDDSDADSDAGDDSIDNGDDNGSDNGDDDSADNGSDTGDDNSSDAGDDNVSDAGDDGSSDAGDDDAGDGSLDNTDNTDDAGDGDNSDADAGLDSTGDAYDSSDAGDDTADPNDGDSDTDDSDDTADADGTDNTDDTDSDDTADDSDSDDGTDDATPDLSGASNSTDTTGTDGTADSDTPDLSGGASNSTDTGDTGDTGDNSDDSNDATNSTSTATPSAPPAAANSGAQCAQSNAPPNAATQALIEQFEGFVPSPKPDPIELPTVGFGHKCVKANCAEVPFSFPLSQSTAAQLLVTDASKATTCLQSLIGNNVVLNDNQFGALTSFTFNLGCGAFSSSTMRKRLNAGEDPNTVAAAEIPRFNKAGGKVLSGLSNRRAAEVQLFQTPSDITAHPLC